VHTRLIGILLLLWSGIADAGRPLVTEDAGVLGKGECEIEAFYQNISASDAPTTLGWSAQLACGLGVINTQIALGGLRVSTAGEHTNGLAFIGKTGLRELTDDQVGIALAYEIGGAKVTGQSFKHETTGIRGVVTVPVDKWLFHGNLGWFRLESEDSDATTWFVAAERTEIGPFDLAAEAFGEFGSPTWVNLAARWALVPEKFFLDASYGMQTSGEREKLFTIGVKFAF
jgi:hypothetical protein